MNSGIDDYLDHVDEWKARLHEKLKGMNAREREAFWQQIREQARTRGLRVVEPDKKPKRSAKKARRTG
jgi:hypothetical protein